jgi:hypothetical protein
MSLRAAKSDGIRKIYKISHGLDCRQYCHIHNSIFESQQVLTVQQELFILWGYLSSPLPHTRLIVGTALTVVLLLYLDTVIATAGAFEP